MTPARGTDRARTNRARTVRAVIFDFNGVIVDDEPLHRRAFAAVLERLGHTLTEEEYVARYLGYDDRECFESALRDRTGRDAPADLLDRLVEEKADEYRALIDRDLRLYPGAKALVERLAPRVPLAINSGARAHEIALILARTGMTDLFLATVSADEVAHGKPAPDGYDEAFRRLRARVPDGRTLAPRDCLVIEDAPNGIRAALAAGLRCVAVASTRPASDLHEAERVYADLTTVDADDLLAPD